MRHLWYFFINYCLSYHVPMHKITQLNKDFSIPQRVLFSSKIVRFELWWSSHKIPWSKKGSSLDWKGQAIFSNISGPFLPPSIRL